MRKKNQNRLLCATTAECHDLSLRRAAPTGIGITSDLKQRTPCVRVTSRMLRHRPLESTVPQVAYHQRPSCGSTVPVIVIGLSVAATPSEGVQRGDGRRAVRHFLGK